MRTAVVWFLLLCAALTLPGVGYAQTVGNYMCDPGAENCRTKLIALIDAEDQAIDAAFWFMEDTRFSQALIRAHNRNVDVRVITDMRGWTGNSDYAGYPGSKIPVDQLYAAGVPIRHKNGTGGILHFKTMIFHGLNMVEFSGGNYSGAAFVREGYPSSAPYSNYVDEAIVFTNDDSLVKSFLTRFDDLWTDVTTGTQKFANYCPSPIPAAQGDCVNRPLSRAHDPFLPLDAEMNFVPLQNFRSRAVARYNAETVANGGGIDAIIYRITDAGHTNALIAAAKRGVRVRVITEPLEYRNEGKFWNSYNFDLLWLQGKRCADVPSECANTGSISVRLRAHPGLLHEKLTVLRGQQMVIVGSSNWTSSSASSQTEHNLFATRVNRPWVYDWSATHFDHKWDNLTTPFTPQAPDTPVLKVPANAAQNQPLTVTLKWHAGYWGQKYDVWFGTSASSMALIATAKELGPSQSASDFKSFAVPTALVEGTTYFWQVRTYTMAGLFAHEPCLELPHGRRHTADHGRRRRAAACLPRPRARGVGRRERRDRGRRQGAQLPQRRCPDAIAVGKPDGLLRGRLHGHGRRPVQDLAARQGAKQQLRERLRVRAVRRQRQRVRRAAVAHRHDVGDDGQHRGLHLVRSRRVGLER